MFVSIIIPTKDEPAIQELIDEIEKTIKQSHEIIVVDKSRIKSDIRAAVVISQTSDGLGNAFIEGLSYAKGDIIALMDGDGSHRAEDLQNMLSKIEDYDIVLGSKLLKDSINNDSFGRKIITVAIAWITRAILWIDVKDPMTGFMLARREVFDKIDLKPRGFKVVIETIYKSRARTIEIPIIFRERKAGSSKAGFNRNGLKEFSRILILLIDLKLGRIKGKW